MLHVSRNAYNCIFTAINVDWGQRRETGRSGFFGKVTWPKSSLVILRFCLHLFVLLHCVCVYVYMCTHPHACVYAYVVRGMRDCRD